MNVLFVSESQGWSGGAAQLLALGKGLKSLDWPVTLASPEDGEVARRAVEAGLGYVPFFPRQDYDLISAYRLARLLEAEKIDVLHAHHPRAHAVCLASLYLSSRRPAFFVTRRVSFPLPRNPFSRLKYRNPRIDGFVAVAESVRETLIAGGVEADRVRTIPSGVDTEVFRPGPADEALRSELKIAPDVPVIGKIGNYGEWKGQSVFLEAAVKFLAEGREAVFLMAGRDTDSDGMREEVTRRGLPGESVRLLGFRTDVPRLLSICSVSVNAALRGEGISGALRESLAMRVPVVASDAGGNPELVVEGKTGRLFKAGSSEELSRVLGEVLDRPEEAREQTEEGCRVVAERYSVEMMVRRTSEYYREVVEKKRA